VEGFTVRCAVGAVTVTWMVRGTLSPPVDGLMARLNEEVPTGAAAQSTVTVNVALPPGWI
jgi:hypothetical protein